MPNIINNGQHGTVYLVCRDNQNALPQSFQAAKPEVKNHPATPGNYELLPGKQAQVNANQFIIAATDTTVVTGPRQVGQAAEQNLWS